MEWISFIKQYITKPRTVGAILPSSEKLADKMIKNIDFENTKYIVEYGPGTGVFTKKIIESRNKDTVFIVIECNYRFYKILKEKYINEKKLYIINDSAENIDKYLKMYDITYVDYVISGLPFASLPQDVSNTILNKTRELLKGDGKFITFQYTLLRRNLIGNYFDNIDIKKEFVNIPPAYVFVCNNLE